MRQYSYTQRPMWSDEREREFARILEQRHTQIDRGHPVGQWPSILLANILDEHTSPAHAMADRTPVSDPNHSVVGKEFGGHDFQDSDFAGKRWFCFSHDAAGFWMYATDGSGHWTNVSEAAIGRAFHEIHKDPDGRVYCHWFRGKVPGYVKAPA